MDPRQVEDLTSLQHLTVDTIVKSLKSRWTAGHCYTYVGDVLVAVNPYRRINIYDDNHRKLYRNTLSRNQNPPHIYWMANLAYQRMRTSRRDQIILISGESGAGKTESTKFIVEHISYICDHKADNLHEKLNLINPLLEAFGNATTAMNENSSRFGKYIELAFNNSGTFKEASITTYILEKSRVIHHTRGEKTFHIFYYFLAGLSREERESLGLDHHDNYRILWPSGGNDREQAGGVFQDEQDLDNNARRYIKIRKLMQSMGLPKEDADFINTMLAAILHLTNIRFARTDYHDDGVYIENDDVLLWAASLLQVDADFLRSALVSHTYQIRGVENHTTNSLDQAEEGRDSLARSLYEGLFSLLVKKVNSHLQSGVSLRPMDKHCVGILDMSGFEDLGKNGFDQLLINVANERLQYYFNEYLFSREQREMEEGGIDWSHIHYENNTDILSLFFGDTQSRDPGMLGAIDEESSLRQSTDRHLLDRLHQQYASREAYKRPAHNGPNFTVVHFAGRVDYMVEGFLEKNRDRLSHDLQACISTSRDGQVAELILHMKDDATMATGTRGRQHRTAIKQFKDSLNLLVDRLSQSQALFVRCIRPNPTQDPQTFEREMVAEQLRYNGLMELAKMRRIGFPVRMDFNDFLDRYQILQYRPRTASPPTECDNLIRMADLQDAQVGNEKVFLKEWHKDQLEHRLRHLVSQVLYVQRRRRGERRGDRFVAVVRQAMARKESIRNYQESIPDIPTRDDNHREVDGASQSSSSENAQPSQPQQGTSGEADKEEKDHFEHLPRETWDMFRHILYESDAADRMSDKILQVIKIFFFIFFFIVMLGGLVFNKLSLLLMASNLQFQNHPPLNTAAEPYIRRERDNQITFLVICLAIPYVINVIFYGQRILGQNLPKFRLWVLVQFMFVESLHICGVSLLVYKVLPNLDLVRGLFILSLSCSLPGFFKILFAQTPIGRTKREITSAAEANDLGNGTTNNVAQKRTLKQETIQFTAYENIGKVLWYFFNILAFLIQVAGVVAFTIGGFQVNREEWKVSVLTTILINGTTESLKNGIFHRPDNVMLGNYENVWAIPVSLFLISLKWWENFVDRDLVLFGCWKIPILEAKAKWHIHRSKGTLVASLCSLLLLCFAPYVIYEEFHFRRPGIKKTDTIERLKYWQNPLVNIGSSLIVYAVSVVVSKVCMQKFCFNLTIVLATPVTLVLILLRCNLEPIELSGNIWFCPERMGMFLENPISQWQAAILVAVWIASLIIGADTWCSFQNRLDITEKLFVTPMYSPAVLEQSMSLNRRRIDDSVVLRHGLILLKATEIQNLRKQTKQGKDKSEEKKKKKEKEKEKEADDEIVPMVYACATLWHETEQEMTQLMKSLFRMDKHQSARRLQKTKIGIYDPEYFDFQAHILFDDAFTDDADGCRVVNSFVKDFLGIVDIAGSSVHECPIALAPPVHTVTPYGGRLIWSLPGGTLLIIHLKDKNKIRHRKRWSQCMYMYYLLAYRLVALCEEDAWKNVRAGGKHQNAFSQSSIYNRFPEEVIRKADNTFILALDGDVDFKPDAVRLLMDLMKKNKNVASACGRIHPIGLGPMVWYQVFGYAIAHWLQKVAEHVFGCVLCSPGCFSLFRGSALMDDNVMRRYLTVAKEPREYIQFDQGEDRWLCTLLIQQGYRIEYCAGSDALTFAPESLQEYFTQQRRWITSTMANVMDLISSYQTTIEKNRDISYGFMLYQLVLFLASLLSPATIILLIGGSYNALLGTGLLESYLLGLSPAIFYCAICVTCKGKTQIYVGIFLSAVYAIIMMLVLVALVANSRAESIASPNVAFLVAITVLFVVAALLHPREFFALTPGLLYMVAIPFSLLFLIIYSLCNMHVVTWGTRELKREKTAEELEAERQEEERKKLKAKNSGILNALGLSKAVSDLKEFTTTVINRRILAGESMPDVNDRMKKLEDLLEVIIENKEPQRNELREMLQKKNQKGMQEEKAPAPNQPPKTQVPTIQTQKIPLETASDPRWIKDELFTKGKLGKIDPKEEDFWKGVLKFYLHPLDSNKQQEKDNAKALLEMRNSVGLGLAMLNFMWIIIIFLFQILKDSLGDELFIPIPLEEGRIEFYEPVGLIFLGFFALLLTLQFIATLIHRVNTILHLISITNIRWPWRKQLGSQEKELEDAIALITKLQSIETPDLDFLEPATDYDDDDVTEEIHEDRMADYSRLDRLERNDYDSRTPSYQSQTEYLNQFGIPMSYEQSYDRRRQRRYHQSSRGRHQGAGVRDITGGTLSHAFNRRFTQLNRQRSQNADRYQNDQRYIEEGAGRYQSRRNYREMLEYLDRHGRQYDQYGYDNYR